MKVLVLSQYYWPESFRINEVVESLQHAGCHITVLTGQPNYPQGNVFDGYHAGGIQVQHHELGYNIYRVPLVPRGTSYEMESHARQRLLYAVTVRPKSLYEDGYLIFSTCGTVGVK